MPLSEREQKILDEIEKNLTHEDARFAHEPRTRPSPNSVTARARFGVATFLIGFVLLIVFFLARVLFVGLLAFGAMVAGIVLLASPVGSLVSSAAREAGRTVEKVGRSFDRRDEGSRRRFRKR